MVLTIFVCFYLQYAAMPRNSLGDKIFKCRRFREIPNKIFNDIRYSFNYVLRLNFLYYFGKNHYFNAYSLGHFYGNIA